MWHELSDVLVASSMMLPVMKKAWCCAWERCGSWGTPSCGRFPLVRVSWRVAASHTRRMMRWGSIRIRTGYIGPVVEVVVSSIISNDLQFSNITVRDRVAPGSTPRSMRG